MHNRDWLPAFRAMSVLMSTQQSKEFSLCDGSREEVESWQQDTVYHADWSDPSSFMNADAKSSDLNLLCVETQHTSSHTLHSGSLALESLTAGIDSLRVAVEASVLRAEALGAMLEGQFAQLEHDSVHSATSGSESPLSNQTSVQIEDALNLMVPRVVKELKMELRNMMEEFRGDVPDNKSHPGDEVAAVGASNVFFSDHDARDIHVCLDVTCDCGDMLEDYFGDANLLDKTQKIVTNQKLEAYDTSNICCDEVPLVHSSILMALQGRWRNASGNLYTVRGTDAHVSLWNGLTGVTSLVEEGQHVCWCGRWLLKNGGVKRSGMCTEVQWQPMNPRDQTIIWWQDSTVTCEAENK